MEPRLARKRRVDFGTATHWGVALAQKDYPSRRAAVRRTSSRSGARKVQHDAHHLERKARVALDRGVWIQHDTNQMGRLQPELVVVREVLRMDHGHCLSTAFVKVLFP